MRYASVAVLAMFVLVPMIGCSKDNGASKAQSEADAAAKSAEMARRDSHPDYKDILGTWKIVSSEWDGSPNKRAVGNRITFETFKMEAWMKDLGEIILDYEIDPTKDPKQLDAMYGFPPDRVHYRAIYELDGNKLKICFRERERPTGYETERGSMWTSHVMERAADQDTIMNLND
jgi:uncharacterized protein (TIGR03067 family)